MGAFKLTIEVLFDVCNLYSFAIFADPLIAVAGKYDIFQYQHCA
jgi:hypothetical protein